MCVYINAYFFFAFTNTNANTVPTKFRRQTTYISLCVYIYVYIYNMYSLLKPMIVYSMILHQKHVPLSHRSYSILNGCIALYAPMSYIILWDEFAMSCCWVMYATLDITR